MSSLEAVVLGIGLLVLLAGAAGAYRYTASPKAGERMAEANRRYVPPQEPDVVVDWPFAAKVFGAVLALRLLLLFTGVPWSWIASPALWTVAIIWFVRRRDKRRREETDDAGGLNDGRNQSNRQGS